jgi:hypothetical protein
LARRVATPPYVPPTIPPERALAAIRKQLEALKAFRGRNYNEAHSDEQEWSQFTQSVIELAFGKPSSNLDKFYHARSAGSYSIVPYGGGIPHGQNQRNFESRVQAYESFLKSCISELELILPEKGLAGHYEPGQEYEFYRDIKSILEAARGNVLIVDPYLGTDVIDLYAQAISRNVQFRLLTNKIPPEVLTLARKYASGGNLAVRTSSAIHDRVIFVDQRVWMIGQSLKDAAKNKPTYVIEHDAALARPTYESIWNGGTQVI